jgi:hypothetical protein
MGAKLEKKAILIRKTLEKRLSKIFQLYLNRGKSLNYNK